MVLRGLHSYVDFVFDWFSLKIGTVSNLVYVFFEFCAVVVV